MTTDELLRAIGERGLTVAIHDGKPVLRGPKEEVTPRLLRALRWHREEILKRLAPVVKSVVVVETPAQEPCPACGKGLDDKGRCWSLKCGWRRCQGCGKATGNVFIAHCWSCEMKLPERGGWNG